MDGRPPLAHFVRFAKKKMRTTLLDFEKDLKDLPQEGDQVQLVALSSLRVPPGVKSTKDYVMPPDPPIKDFCEDEGLPENAVVFRRPSAPPNPKIHQKVAPKKSSPKKEAPKEKSPVNKAPKKEYKKHKALKKDPKEPSIEELLEAMQNERKKRDPLHPYWTKEEVLEVLCRSPAKANEEKKTDRPLVVNSVVKQKTDDDDARKAKKAAKKAKKEEEKMEMEEKKRPVLIGKDGKKLNVLVSYSDLRPEDVPADVPRVLGKGRPPLTPEKGQKQRELTEDDIERMKLLESLPELPPPGPYKVVKTPPLDELEDPFEKAKAMLEAAEMKTAKSKSPIKEKSPTKEKSPKKQKTPSPVNKSVQDEILATVKEMNGEPTERVQMIPGSLLITRMEDGINIQITVRIFVPAGSRLMDIRIECPKFKPSRIHFDGKWMSIE